MTRRLLLLSLIAAVSGCTPRSANAPAGPKTSAAPGQPSAAAPAGAKRFYWVQAVKGHPVHQLTQLAFREGCAKAGYACEVLGTDGPDIPGTIAMAEQALARGDAAGMAIWTGNPAYNALIARAGKQGVPVILPHFPTPEGSAPGATGVISCDPAAYAVEIANRVGAAMGGKGTVAVTQGSFNTTENMVAETLRKTMAAKYPAVKVLPSQEEGFEPMQAIPKAVAILQAHSDVTAAVSTTGGGAQTWAGAQRQTSRKLTIVAMDYTRVNLDLVRSGEVYAIVAQPLWQEAMGAAELLSKAAKHEKVPWWTKLPAPFVTKADLKPYYDLLDHVEMTIGK